MNRTAIVLLATALSPLWAQPPKPVISPEVSADNRVTFRLRAPNAKEVSVAMAGAKPVPLTRDDAGVWSVTTEPLAPDYYGYSFVVDGAPALDPANRLRVPNYIWQSSEAHVPGTDVWEVSNVPHGELHRHFYHSAIIGDDRDYYVYTPPAYDPKAKQTYPVFYLLHGFSDDASGWTAVGRANVILDNLIAQGKVKPMLVVMTLGYGAPEILSPTFSSWNDRSVVTRNMTRYTDALLGEVMPQVEKEYRTINDRKSRAIAGLSMGGAESLLTGLNHLDKFAYIGAFSSGGITDKFDEQFPALDAKANDKIKLLWIACGTDDGLIKMNRQFRDWLKEKSVTHTDIETPGAHTWMVWRRNLAAFTPLLFQ